VGNLWRGGQRCSGTDGARIPFGYTLSVDRLTVDPKGSKLVQQIFVGCADGGAPSVVAKTIRKSGASRRVTAGLVRTVASDDAYLGGHLGATGASPALVAPGRFHRAQRTCGH